jgi:positive regulator of sigma E activity
MLRAAVAAYLGPLAGLILGALAGRHWLPGTPGAEWPTLVGAVIGFSIALRLVARYGHAMAKDPRFQPTLLRRSDSGSVSVTFG